MSAMAAPATAAIRIERRFDDSLIMTLLLGKKGGMEKLTGTTPSENPSWRKRQPEGITACKANGGRWIKILGCPSYWFLTDSI